MEIKILKSVLDENADKANKIRERLKDNNILMLNLISSPGSGKTSLLEKILQLLNNKYKIAVIEGDIATDRDAQRLKRFNIPIVLVNTGGSCHLNSQTIENAITEFDFDDLDIIFIENVGNLVCPSEFDVGEDEKVAIISVAEGDDKPGKYPLLFRESGLVILNKIDLLEHVPFDPEFFYRDIQSINGSLDIYEISCLKEKGLDKWIAWINEKFNLKKDKKSRIKLNSN